VTRFRLVTRMRALIVALLMTLVGSQAYAGTAECWWTADDPSHPELSCARLTPALLMSLEGATKAQVVKAMGAPIPTASFASKATMPSGGEVIAGP
jgi:hypothetical protein